MRSPPRPPPLQIYHHPAVHFVSPSSPVFLVSPTNKTASARTPSYQLTPRKSRLLSRAPPPLSPVSEVDESRRPSLFSTKDVPTDGPLDAQLCSLLAEIDTFKSGWYEGDDQDGEDDDENSTELHHELSNVQIIRYSRAGVKSPIRSPHAATPLNQLRRPKWDDSSSSVKNPDASKEMQAVPAHESVRSSSSSIGGLLSNFPMPPTSLPQPAVPPTSVQSTEATLPSPVSPVGEMKSDKRRLVAHLPPSVPAFSED